MTAENLSPALPQPMLSGSGKQNLTLMVAMAGIVALMYGLWTWGQTPDYRVLYGNLSDRDGGAIIESLQQMNVPYKFAEGGGALLVPSSHVHEVRLRLASQGLPRSTLAGFEVMENQKFGTSQFLEQVNYQRALEGELARSVQTLAAVQSARVHLAIPKPSVFVKEQKLPSASVVLGIHPGRALDAGQVSGIVHLIASSVSNMPAENVTVVDQSGALLSTTTKDDKRPLDATQLQYVRQIEQDYIQRVEAIIAPLIGAKNVRAQVTADIDFSQIEQAAEIFKPNQNKEVSAVRSQQISESNNSSGKNAAGVPGALSNQPPQPATAPIVTPADAIINASGGGSDAQMRKESTVNFEVDRTISYTKLPVGSIKRISVAVVLNNRSITGKNGKVTSKPLSEIEKTQMTELVREAVGFDSKRGDSLSVMNSAFNVEKEIAMPDVPLWQQPEMIDLAKNIFKYLLIAGIGLFLLLGVIRPALKNYTAASAAATAALQQQNNPQLVGHSEASGQAMPTQAISAYENNLQAAKQLAQKDPKIVASVVQGWVSNNE